MKKNNDLYKITILLIMILLFVSFQLRRRLSIYQVENAFCFDDKTLLVMVDQELRRKLEKGKFIYFQGKKLFYDVASVQENILQLNLAKEVCHDKVISIAIFDTKKTIFQILIESWRSK